MAYGHLVNCAGLFADQIAWSYDVGLQYQILPFRGQFYRLRPQSKVKVRGNIYPVPDLRNPFLGVHFTRRPEGDVTIGPSALPLLGREQYRGLSGMTMRDGMAMAKYLVRLFTRNQDHFRSIAWRELLKLPDIPTPQLNETEAPGPLCEVRLRKGDVSIGLIGAVLTLGTPQDVTLQELRVEMFMPADEASEATLVELGR